MSEQREGFSGGKTGTETIGSGPGYKAWIESRSTRDWFRVLDELQSNIMVADTELTMVFANKRAIHTFRALEKEIMSEFHISVNSHPV